MTFTSEQELEADRLQTELVRILGQQKLPYSEQDKEVIRKGVKLLKATWEDIISPRVRIWFAQQLAVDRETGPRGRRAMEFFNLPELESKDKLMVMALTLDYAITYDTMRPEAHLELFYFFLYPQVPVP